MSEMRLDEAAIRAKVIELLDWCNEVRINLWLSSGVLAGVLEVDLTERVMREELPRRSADVQRYWLGDCNHHGLWN